MNKHWWKFWNPRSDFVGGLIAGTVIVLLINTLFGVS